MAKIGTRCTTRIVRWVVLVGCATLEVTEERYIPKLDWSTLSNCLDASRIDSELSDKSALTCVVSGRMGRGRLDGYFGHGLESPIMQLPRVPVPRSMRGLRMTHRPCTWIH